MAKKTKEPILQMVRVIRMYRDKETLAIHKPGETLNLTAARAQELKSYPKPYVELLPPIVPAPASGDNPAEAPAEKAAAEEL